MGYFKIHWNTSMKILYLKGCKWLLSQNQQVRNDFFGYRWYETLARHIKPFLKKALKWKDISVQTMSFLVIKLLWFALIYFFWVITESFIAAVRNNIRLLLRKMWFQDGYSHFMKVGKPCFENISVLKTFMAVWWN